MTIAPKRSRTVREHKICREHMALIVKLGNQQISKPTLLITFHEQMYKHQTNPECRWAAGRTGAFYQFNVVNQF